MLTSDLPFPYFDSYDFGIGITGKDTLSPTTPLSNFKDYYPANYGDGAPDLPAGLYFLQVPTVLNSIVTTLKKQINL